MLTQADFMSESLTTQLTSKWPLSIMGSSCVYFQTVRSTEHFLTLNTGVHISNWERP